jgi:hypothetical protein
MKVMSKPRALPVFVALVLLVLVAPAGPADAAATTPCWQRVIDDWFDGEISGSYAPPCYTEAVEHLPTDVSIYSDAEDAIRAALLTRLRSGPIREFAVAAKTSGRTARALADVSPASKRSTGAGTTAEQGAVAEVGLSGTSAPIPILLALGFAGAVAATGAFGWMRKRRVSRAGSSS